MGEAVSAMTGDTHSTWTSCGVGSGMRAAEADGDELVDVTGRHTGASCSPAGCTIPVG